MILSTITFFGRDLIHDSLHHKVTLLSRGLTRTSASTGVKSVPRKFSLERRKDHRMRIYLWLLLRVRRKGIWNMWFTLKRRVLKPTMTRKTTRGFLFCRVGVKRLRTFYRVPSFFLFFLLVLALCVTGMILASPCVLFFFLHLYKCQPSRFSEKSKFNHY